MPGEFGQVVTPDFKAKIETSVWKGRKGFKTSSSNSLSEMGLFRVFIILVFVTMTLVLAFTQGQEVNSEPQGQQGHGAALSDEIPEASADLLELSRRNSLFAFDLFKEVTRSAGGQEGQRRNRLVSPFSVSSLLSLLRLGAEGQSGQGRVASRSHSGSGHSVQFSSGDTRLKVTRLKVMSGLGSARISKCSSRSDLNSSLVSFGWSNMFWSVVSSHGCFLQYGYSSLLSGA